MKPKVITFVTQVEDYQFRHGFADYFLINCFIFSFFIPKCARCCLPLQPNDIVHRSRQLTFHAHCFQCVYCGRQLKTGDQYFCIDGQVVCQQDYLFAVGQNNNNNNVGDVMFPIPQIPPFFAELDPNLQMHHRSGSSKKPPKRPRTILNSSQRKAFKIAFEKGPKPSKKVREQLAKETGLSVRVVQVWFQNQRAKVISYNFYTFSLKSIFHTPSSFFRKEQR